jgi:geranylgeranyl diphosphate synthase, type I
MSLKNLMESMLPAVEKQLQDFVSRLDKPYTHLFHEMLTYHMGWSGPGAGPETTGKRIRPILVLLSCSASGGNWEDALPAAACIELIHNFSLAHDDIQDLSDLRRGRLTVWKKWGKPQAINVGDILFILAQLALLDIKKVFSPEKVLHAEEIIQEACLALSCGQFLDISYQERSDLALDDYWHMVSGKTAALVSACTDIGALLGGADDLARTYYRDFGQYLGLAFQVQDDYLGIWGDAVLTGKSTVSDLVTGKKSFPILHGLSRNGPFAHRWHEGGIIVKDVPSLSALLSQEGSKLFTQETVSQMNDMAIKSLRLADPQGEAGEALFELSNILINRQT